MAEWILSASVLTGVVLLLRLALKGKVSPRLQYALWAIVLVRLLIPVSFFDSAISVQNIRMDVMRQPELQQMHTEPDAPAQPDAPRTDVSGNESDPLNAGGSQGAHTPGYSGGGTALPQPDGALENPVPTLPQTGTNPEPQTTQTGSVSPGGVLMLVWLMGMAAVAGALVGCNVHFSRRLRRTRKALEVPQSPVEVFVTDAVETPCLFGLFHPAIYLTPDVAREERTRAYVLAHEITHYRQFDYVWSVLRAVCLALHWYNPLVWMAAKVSRQDGELACDQGTLELLGEEHRSEYGKTLIGLTTKARFTSALVTATTMTGGKRAIKERIVILMKHPKTALLTMIAVILICGFVVGCTFTGAVDEPGETTEPVETTQPEEMTAPVVQPVEPGHPHYEYYVLLNDGNDNHSWYDAAMTFTFADPWELDLGELFYNGLSEKSWESVDEKTRAALEAEGFLTTNTLHILPREEVEAIVRDWFGVSVSEVMYYLPEGWVYLEETDCYYTNNNKVRKMTGAVIEQVEETDNGLIYITYEANQNSTVYINGYRNAQMSRMVITLQKKPDGGYYILSNTTWADFGQTRITEPVVTIPVTADPGDPLAMYQQLLSRRWMRMALSCEFESPEQIDLYDLFRDGITYSHRNNYPENVKKFLSSVGLGYYEIIRVPVREMERIMHNMFGISSADVVSEIPVEWVYHEDGNCYYAKREKMGNDNFAMDALEVTHAQEQSDGTVLVYYTPVDATCHLNGQPMVVTLRKTGQGLYQVVSNRQAENAGFITLNAEQIEQVNEAFDWMIQGERNIIYQKPISRFFTSYYGSPQEIDLGAFLRNFSAQGIVENWARTITEEEFSALARQDDFPYRDEGVTELSQMRTQINKYTGEAVDAVIYRYTGIHLSELNDAEGRGDALYSKEYDSYYNFVSDVESGVFICVSGRIFDGYVELYSQNAVLTLREENGKYYIQSHLPLKWVYPEELTDEQIARVNAAFSPNFTEKGNENPITNLFMCYYSAPREIDLARFVAYFGYGREEFTKAEEKALCEKYGLDLSYGYNVNKFSADDVDAALYRGTGYHIEELFGTRDVSNVRYLEEYDSYYSFVSDADWGTFVCTGGRIFDGYVELYSQNAVLTLREANGKYYIYSHLPLKWVYPEKLTDEQIAQVNTAFQSVIRDSAGNYVSSPISSFFTCYYESPDQIDLAAFARYFSAVDFPYYNGTDRTWRVWGENNKATEEEFQALRKKENFPFKSTETLADMPVPLHRIESGFLNEVLLECAGNFLSDLEDAGQDNPGLYYLEEYDAYYNFTSDFSPGEFLCVGGLDYGTYVELYSQDAVLTLRKTGIGDYYIQSHLPRE